MVLDLHPLIIEHAVMLYRVSNDATCKKRTDGHLPRSSRIHHRACITQFYQSSNKQTFLLLCFNTTFWSNGQYWIGIVEEKGATKPANVHGTTLEKHSNSEPHLTITCKSTCHNTWKDTPNSNPHSTRTSKSTCCNTGENTLNSNPHSTRTCKSTCHTGKNTLNSNPYSTRMSKSSCHNTGKPTPNSKPHSTRTCKSLCNTGENTHDSNTHSIRTCFSACCNNGKKRSQF